MDYNTLNEINKGKMRGTCNNDEHFEWEDSEFLEIMKGRLPKTRNYSYNSEVQSLYSKLSSLFQTREHRCIFKYFQSINTIRINCLFFGLCKQAIQLH